MVVVVFVLATFLFLKWCDGEELQFDNDDDVLIVEDLTWVFSFPPEVAANGDGWLSDEVWQVEAFGGDTLLEEGAWLWCFLRKSYGDWWPVETGDAAGAAAAPAGELVKSITVFDLDSTLEGGLGDGDGGKEVSDDEAEVVDNLRLLDWYSPAAADVDEVPPDKVENTS